MSRGFALILLAAGAILVVGIVLLRLQSHRVPVSVAEHAAEVGCRQVDGAYRQHRSSVWLSVSARVERLLPDSYGRFDHQRFIIRCSSGQTVLIVNDITVGERAPVRPGDLVGVHGQYVWNREGGLIHFTHHSDTGGPGGWILLGRRVYALPLRTIPLAWSIHATVWPPAFATLPS